MVEILISLALLILFKGNIICYLMVCIFDDGLMTNTFDIIYAMRFSIYYGVCCVDVSLLLYFL
jgi:hypothetical protein